MQLTNDTADGIARHSDGVRADGRLVDNHLPHHQFRLVHRILRASDHQRPVLVSPTLASEVDPRLGRLLDLKTVIATVQLL